MSCSNRYSRGTDVVDILHGGPSTLHNPISGGIQPPCTMLTRKAD